MPELIECVPNISEGEDTAVIDDIVASVKTARILDLHADPDHNRSVITLVGDAAGIAQAAFDLTERAMQLLDIREHQGAHPFIGVVDVIPFVPLADCPVEKAHETAKRLGERLWNELKLPVYFYGEAARIPERRDLPQVRKGGYALLKKEIDSPSRRPDIGAGLHVTAGAAAVGVRDFLIAFNINLKTNELDIAVSIARNIREKHGGLPGVRAIGVELKSRGLTQVSINVTNHRETSLKQVFDEVKKWAREYRTEIINSEIVGLLPESAVFPGLGEHLKLPVFSDNIILERRLA